ncbi:MAG TPA: BON domain-containing protein [Steroidobacter sp.]|uniref:BON domain-containing protein n=1 Tax=Steroidobacter sp. TaxID=1978227 RepID=UPI002ED90C70
MAAHNPSRETWRDAPLSGDNLYGDRDNLRRYRDNERDEHRRFAALYEREHGGGLARRDRLVEYDDVDVDYTGGEFRPGRRHATEGGYAYGNYGGVTPAGRRYEGASDEGPNTPRIVTNRGRGPRGYQRADQRIREEICDRLTDDDRIDASDIDVKVENGEVTLSGTLRSRNAKRWAIQVAEQTSGVKDVHTSIRVSDEQVRQHTY